MCGVLRSEALLEYTTSSRGLSKPQHHLPVCKPGQKAQRNSNGCDFESYASLG
jgi:hypothetical protein